VRERERDEGKGKGRGVEPGGRVEGEGKRERELAKQQKNTREMSRIIDTIVVSRRGTDDSSVGGCWNRWNARCDARV
jgi:hypothetical protein